MIRIRKKYSFLYTAIASFCLLAGFSLPVSAASCSPLSQNEGAATATFTVSTGGTYRLWAHTYAQAVGNQALGITVDQSCPVTLGGSTTTIGTFTWTGNGVGSTNPVSVSLSPGTHTMTVAGESPSIGVDRILLTTDSSCMPTGTGSNCRVAKSSAVVTPKKPGQTKTTNATKKPSVVRLVVVGLGTMILAAGFAWLFFHFTAKRKHMHLPDSSSTVVTMPGTQDLEPVADSKRTKLIVFVFAAVCGLITVIAMADTNSSIVIDFLNANTTGQATIVSSSGAVAGKMVQFGTGSSSASAMPSTPSTPSPAPQSSPSTTTNKSSSSGSTSNASSGSSSSGSRSGSSGSGGTVSSCTNPSYSSSDAEATDNTDDSDGYQYYWVNNDAWSGSHGPQTIYVCSPSSWYAVSNQTDNGGQVETYPDTEYDVGGRDNPSTKTIAQWNSIVSTFSENFPSGGSWDAGYDLWTNNWTNETMVWNQWAGSQAYWYTQATITASISGVNYKFIDNGGELIFMRETQVLSGSVDILGIYQWEVSHGYASNNDVPTQLEYGVEVCATNGNETFALTGLTFSLN